MGMFLEQLHQNIDLTVLQISVAGDLLQIQDVIFARNYITLLNCLQDLVIEPDDIKDISLLLHLQ